MKPCAGGVTQKSCGDTQFLKVKHHPKDTHMSSFRALGECLWGWGSGAPQKILESLQRSEKGRTEMSVGAGGTVSLFHFGIVASKKGQG